MVLSAVGHGPRTGREVAGNRFVDGVGIFPTGLVGIGEMDSVEIESLAIKGRANDEMLEFAEGMVVKKELGNETGVGILLLVKEDGARVVYSVAMPEVTVL